MAKKVQKVKKISEYGKQLAEKQELKKTYGLREAQLRILVEKAQKMPGNAGENLLILLESRLDNTIFRLGFAKTRPQARQFVTHGLFLLNGKRVDIPSISLKENAVVEPRKKDQFKDVEFGSAASWLELDKKKLIGKVKHLPSRNEIDTPIDENIVIQFYSR